MAYTLKMPIVGETVTEGTIERWLKRPGETIEKYEPIVEINTDKVNVELPSPVSGTLKEIMAKEGETIEVGAPMAVIDEVPGEVPAEFPPPGGQTEAPKPSPQSVPSPSRAEVAAGPTAETVPTTAREATTATMEEQKPAATEGQGVAATAAERTPAEAQVVAAERPRATPRVRKVAEELGIGLDGIRGTGPGGRITEEDVHEAAQERKAAVSQPETPAAQTQPTYTQPERPAAPAAAGADEEVVPLTSIRRTIAQRMTASKFSAPEAWMVVEADVTNLVKLREAEKEAFRQRHGVDLTYLPFVARAVAQALPHHPYLNASWGEDKIILRKRINLNIAIATERGLVVPVVHDADRLTITGLARAIHEVVDRARSNRLQIEDVQAGTFTVDNTGAFGSIVSMPIINQGQAAIITMEAITKRPTVVAGDAIAVRSILNLCLSFDHRIVDGHQAGLFMADVKRRIEAFGPETGID